MTDKQYVIVTAISSHRMRYCIPIDELQNMNSRVPVEGNECEWAMDSVTMQEVKEFSQDHIGEQIIDSRIVDEEEMLRQFDEDNEYLMEWSTEKKIEWVNDWRFK